MFTVRAGRSSGTPAKWAIWRPEFVPLPLDPTVVRHKIWQFSPPTRFGLHYRDLIVGAGSVHLYTHANVTSIEANESVSAVDHLRVRTLGVRIEYST